MIYVSSFKKAWGLPGAISVAGKAPEGWPGEEFKKLAPRLWFFLKYKEDGDHEFYTSQYYNEVLSKYNAEEIGRLLEGKILCCYEEEGFCHRFLIKEWLEKAGIKVEVL
jgi:hypothetical protein